MRFLTTLFFMFAFSGISWAENSPQEIAGKVQENYSKIADFKGEFTQISFVKTYGSKKELKGIVYFKKPNMMFWDYSSPEKQKLVTDGKTMWFYQEEDNQVMVRPFANVMLSNTPISYLSGLGNIEKDFRITAPKNVKPESRGYAIEMTPKNEDASFSKVILTFDKNFMVQSSEVYDGFGNVTTIIFRSISLNNGIRKEMFDFKIPKNAEIIKQ